MLLALHCFGVKSSNNIHIYRQPNGNTISYRVVGDEFFAAKVDLNGNFLTLNNGSLERDYNLTKSIFNNNSIKNRETKITFNNAPILNNLVNSKTSPLSPIIIKFPVILVEFADICFSFDNIVNLIDNMLNSKSYYLSGNTGSAAKYFNDNFNNNYEFIFDVFPIIIRMPNSLSYYGSDSNNEIDIRIKELTEEACNEASKLGWNINDYDIKEDGNIPVVNIIYAGYSQAETGIDNDIWPQFFNTSNLSINGKSIKGFACSSELSNLGLNKGDLSGIGTFCHEFSHALGLPDMYDTNGEVEGLSNGLNGSLSIMDYGNYLNFGRTPPFYTAIEKELLGYEAIVPDSDKMYNLYHYSQGGNYYRINSNNDGEYFLLEQRNNTDWDKYIGNNGLIIYHIDKSNKVYGGLASNRRWYYNNINSFAEHPCARVLYFGKDVSEFTNIGESPLLDWDMYPLKLYPNEIKYYNNYTSIVFSNGYKYNNSLTIKDLEVIPLQEGCKIIFSNPLDNMMVNIKLYDNSDFISRLYTNDNPIYISGLKPQTSYSLKLNIQDNDSFGDEFVANFTTSNLLSISLFNFLQNNDKLN